MLSARPLYRLRQVALALRPRVADADIEFARAYLSEGEMKLFLSMERRDQRHGIEVARRLIDGGDGEREVVAAGLLHDCGKGEAPVWLRSLYVLAPAVVSRMAREHGPFWREAAYRLANHVELGARRAAEAGSAPATVRLVSGKVEPHEEAKLRQLHQADGES